jgi:DNA repair photolyase
VFTGLEDRPKVVGMLLRKFDPWNGSLCTCPGKLSLNPYTGCAHGCLYCYASSYIPRFSDCRPKIGLLERLGRDVRRVEPGVLVSVANSSDPYPPMERNLHLTRECIKILRDSRLRLQLVTKSDIVTRDIDLLKAMPCVVSITLTTLSDEISRRLEPFAPSPERRLQAIHSLRSHGIPVTARLDPIIPGINDSEVEDLVSAVCGAGALHITSSTYKSRPDSWKRLREAFPEESVALQAMFGKGGWTSGCRYLPSRVRFELMQKFKNAATESGATFSTCREGFPNEVGVFCDGSHLTEKGL